MNILSTQACDEMFRGVTKRDKVMDKLPGSQGDFTKEVALRPELEESF